MADNVSRAHAALNYAVLTGRITRPNRCERCGHAARTAGHHAQGYEPENWLVVEWLCRSCHKSAHADTAERARAAQKLGVAARLQQYTPEERSAQQRQAWHTWEAAGGDRAARMRRLHEAMTPEQRRQRGLKAGAASAAARRRRQ